MEYVLTPQNGDRVIYGALDADSDHEAGLTVLRAATGDDQLAEQIFFYKALPDALAHDTHIEPSVGLVGHGWFELAPTEPLPGGQPGGNHQDGDALARRFALRRADRNWAVVTRYVYLAVPIDQPFDTAARVVEVMSEFMVCKDLHDVQGTEFFSYETFTGLPYEPTHANVRREAMRLFSSDILWDGREFDEGANGKLVRP
jgi:hypothetical protein